MQDFKRYIESTNLSADTKATIYKMYNIVSSSQHKDDISIETQDFQEIVSYGEKIFFGIGESSSGSVSEAIDQAIQNGSLSVSTLGKVAGFLLHFKIHPNQSFLKIAEAMETLYENAHDEASFVWGTTNDELLGVDDIKVAILFTGFGQTISYTTNAANNAKYKS